MNSHSYEPLRTRIILIIILLLSTSHQMIVRHRAVRLVTARLDVHMELNGAPNILGILALDPMVRPVRKVWVPQLASKVILYVVCCLECLQVWRRELGLVPQAEIVQHCPHLWLCPLQQQVLFALSTREKPSVPLSLIHISEPTRLLSISYAVFCLKKKKKI
eukprot:TRINITY_DN14662_c0_g1_i5.p1 TRINITY_DN14662_c0_g1~~TRINITY_DN14662_c0_g1_i5.p1  ORF type:complete len:162 (+),score=11.18 TRINITY_DN14662_c0_g1_i5:286-771(+)